MPHRIPLYRAIAEREKASRREAERLLEVKSRELYQRNAEARETEVKLKTTAALITEVMAATPDGILAFDPAYRVALANPSAWVFSE